MTASNSIMLFENEHYGVRLEYNQNFAIVHLPYTHNMAKGVFLDMKYKLEDWWKFLSTVGYSAIWCAVNPDDEKINKLVTMLDFKEAGFADNMRVYKYTGE